MEEDERRQAERDDAMVWGERVREGHGIRERNHQIDLLRRTRAWFDRWLA